MKHFAFWLIGLVIAFGALAGGLHGVFSANPSRVLVVVDSSLPMAGAWDRLPALLDQIDDARYAEFALRTEKSSIHSWRDELALGQARAYGARDFGFVSDASLEADRRIIVTNAPESELPPLDGWELLRP